MLERIFKLKENGTNARTEIMAGFVTFMTMAYIIFVNPGILKDAGIDPSAATVATCLAAGLATLIMGFLSNYPFALAAGMGLNGFLVYSLVLTEKVPWQVAMGVVVLEGIIVTVLVLTNIREMIMSAIPMNLKRAIGVGIGLFIAFIGLKNAGFVVANPATMVTYGAFTRATLIAAVGLILTAILMVARVRGSILIGIVATTVVAWLSDVLLGVPVDQALVHLPKLSAIAQIPKAAQFSTMFRFDLGGVFKAGLYTAVFSFLITDFFDTMGTVVAVGGEAGQLDKNGRLPRLRSVLLADSIGAMIGGAFGCSSNTTYIESASGVAEGGRTGLTAVVVGLLFLLATFFYPLVGVVPAIATAPALILVGYLMMVVVKEIDWDKMDEAIPAFLTILTIPLTSSISRGIGFGFISYVCIKVANKKAREVHPLMYLVAVLFATDFVIDTLHKLNLM